MFDDKNLDGSITCHGDTSYSKISHGGASSSESGLIDHSGGNDNNMNCHRTCNTNKEICGEQEMTPVTAVAKMKVELVDRDNESMKCDLPIDGIMKSIGKSESGESTPSSIMPNRDWLDLNSWLPSEVCSIYRKKGISKLYPWQVPLNMRTKRVTIFEFFYLISEYSAFFMSLFYLFFDTTK